MRKNTRNTRVMALSALFVALGMVILYMGCFFEVIDLTVAAVASLLILISVIEMGKGTACLIWIATSILALLLLPNKLIGAEYAIFMGCFPLVKALAEKLPRVLSWMVKLVFVLVAMSGLVLLSHFVFSMPMEAPLLMVGLFLLALITGVIFDIALTRLVTLYLHRLRRVLRIDRMLK